MKNVFQLFFVFSCLILLTTCDKGDLPKPTQSGKNTMGARVNGKPWVASACWGCTGSGSGKSARYIQNNLSISGQESSGESNITISIRLNNINKPDTYIINSTAIGGDGVTHGMSIGYRPNVATGNKYYAASQEHTGVVTITKFDHANKIVSGTFSGTLRNVMDHEDTLTVTNGRFDLILYTH